VTLPIPPERLESTQGGSAHLSYKRAQDIQKIDALVGGMWGFVGGIAIVPYVPRCAPGWLALGLVGAAAGSVANVFLSHAFTHSSPHEVRRFFPK
jgi:hypothetical protein